MLRKKNWELANYLLKKGARPNCMLRWQFVVRNQALSPSEILNFMEVNNISPVLKSDDGLNFKLTRSGTTLTMQAYNGTEWVELGKIENITGNNEIVFYGVTAAFEWSNISFVAATQE